MAMHVYVGLMYGCVWQCMAMHGYVGLCTAVYGSAGACIAMIEVFKN